MTSLAAGVRAQVAYEIEDTFYDCSLNEVGWRLLACNGQVYTWGVQDGAYRYRRRYACDDSSSTDQWYYKSGSLWVAFSGPPGPNC
jgi:hypothetical protein